MRRPEDIIHNGRTLRATLDDHAVWLTKGGGEQADLSYADLRHADLSNTDLGGTDLSGTDLRYVSLNCSSLVGANMNRSSLFGTDLRNADLFGANLRDVNMSGTDMRGADLRAYGNMRELRTMQFDRWAIGYTADTLQIGCKRRPIEMWRRWHTEAGRKWVAKMDPKALEWADRNLDLVLAIIDANPATPTGKELL